MTSKAAEKIVDGLALLLEGFSEVQEAVGAPKAADDGDDDDDAEEDDAETAQAILQEVKAAVESVIDSEDYAPEELAAVVSVLTEALEEIDPNVFSDETVSVDDDEDEDEDIDDEDLEDLDDEDILEDMDDE